jgi:pSer/pThr/pTyr-binding forkhead associated (FHA) protein
MSDKISSPTKKRLSPDWFVRGILTRLGETFDRFTGRNWKPSSSLATSQLIEKLKTLLDAEVLESGEKGRIVPHHIKLKMQWDKFSTDAEESLKKLKTELITAAIDHINDRRYHTYAPIQLEIKPDYFTEGVKLSASFDKFAEEKEEESEVNVTIPDLKNIVIPLSEEEIVEPEKEIFIATFVLNNQPKQVNLVFSPKERKGVGRTKENDLWLEDASVSKHHAALVLGADNQLLVADTGSTNGTFVDGMRIAYGKAIAITDSDKLRFGMVDVALQRIIKEEVKEQFTAKLSPNENFVTNTDFSVEANNPLKNEYATNADFSTNQNFSINGEVASNGKGETEKISSVLTLQEIKTNGSPAKEETSTEGNEKESAVDFEEKIPVKIKKDEL